MALTPFRWLAMAVAGCLLVCLAVLEFTDRMVFRDPDMRGPIDSTERRLERLTGQQRQLAYGLAQRYRVLHIIDSLKPVAAVSRDTGVVRAFIDPAFSPAARRTIDSALARAKREKPARATGTGIDIFVVLDSSRYVRRVLRGPLSGADARFAIPARPGERCRVYVRLGSNLTESLGPMRTQAGVEQLLGPCAYYGAFGMPGSRVEEWLVVGGWRHATDGTWNHERPAPSSPFDISETRYFGGPSRALGRLNPRTAGMRCIIGEVGACEVAASEFLVPRAGARTFGDASASLQLGGSRYVNTSLGDQGHHLLADAVRTLGHERFQTFWSSSDSVPVAFEKGTGKAWGVWIREWMIAKYGTVERGPRVTSYAFATSALILALALGLGLSVSMRRQYT